MSPFALFVRTLLKTSAVFIGFTFVFLHPDLEWSAPETVTARQGPAEAVVDLIEPLDDCDAGVRPTVDRALWISVSTR